MKTHNKSLSAIVRGLAGGIALVLMASPLHAAPDHLWWAESIAVNVTPDKNVYGSNPNFISWAGVGGATVYENRTECSSFITRVLKQTYGWSDAAFRAWTGSNSPNAAKYHNMIQAENGFALIQNVADIQAGDIIAVKYPDGSSPSGHAMMAYGAAVLRTATKPLIDDTVQYEIKVIDSSNSGHGPYDTRLMEDGTWDSGAGIGTLRLYADNSGNIMGYSWSTYSNSQYFAQSDRHLVVGRLVQSATP